MDRIILSRILELNILADDTIMGNYNIGRRILEIAESDSNPALFRQAYTHFAYLYSRFQTLDVATQQRLGEDMERLMIDNAGKLGDERFEYEALKKVRKISPSDALNEREMELEGRINTTAP